MVHVEHDSRRILPILRKEPFEDVNYELHGGVVVVEQQNLVERRPLRLGARLGDDIALWYIAPDGGVLGHTQLVPFQHQVDAWNHSAIAQADKFKIGAAADRTATWAAPRPVRERCWVAASPVAPL